MTGPSQKYKRRSSNKAGGIEHLDFFVQRTIRMRSRLGSRTSTESLMSLTCVQSAPAWPSLMSPLQTELVLNTHTIVSDVHQNVLKLCEDADSRDRVVSYTRFPPSPNEYRSPRRFRTGQRSRLHMVRVPSHLENLHLHRRGHSLDVTSCSRRLLDWRKSLPQSL